MGASALSLPSLEITIGGGGATLTRRKPVIVHRQAHRAARVAPLEAGGDEYPVQAFIFCLLLHQAGTRHHHRQLHVCRDLAAFGHGCRRT